MTQWYYQSEEQREIGPIGAADLLALVREKKIDAQTMIRKDHSAWFPAGQVGGLFEAASRPSVRFTCPECDGEVAKPPTYCRRCRRVLQYARPHLIEHVIEGYEAPERDKESLSESWKQWVRRLKLQRDERSPGSVKP